MMTTATIDAPGTVVRPGGLVDVPAVVRLLVGPPNPPHPTVPPGQAQRAMRLLLAHYLLEEGRVWVAEHGPGQPHGRPVAAAIWLPGDARPAGSGLNLVLLREMTHPVEFIAAGERVRTALAAARPGEPAWTLTTAGLLDEAWDVSLAAALLSPGLRDADRQGFSVVAITSTARGARQLRPFEFRAPREITPDSGTGVWLTTREPSRNGALREPA